MHWSTIKSFIILILIIPQPFGWTHHYKHHYQQVMQYRIHIYIHSLHWVSKTMQGEFWLINSEWTWECKSKKTVNYLHHLYLWKGSDYASGSTTALPHYPRKSVWRPIIIVSYLPELVATWNRQLFYFYLKALQCRALMVHWYLVPVAKIIRTWMQCW